MKITIDLGSIHPIDAGFDPRVHDMPVILAMTADAVHRIEYSPDRGQAKAVLEGTPEVLCEALERAGYRIVPATTPNGRRVEYRGGIFSVQPANDNYWIDCPTLAAALAAYDNPGRYRR